ncbi:MAG TPA: COX15/CtaA family protein [Nitrososphaeraceae archaeon]|nr:COX15/CtaA family protein [Nitrososphaeraceae archaeon]
MSLIKTLPIATLVSVFTLMFIGGYVSASGVGLTCPKWPLCPAGFVPMEEFLIEYFHRSVAAVTGLLVFVTMFFILRSKITPRPMKVASVIAGSAAAGQITLGAIVIIERLHALLVTVHLGLGLLLFSMVLITVLCSRKIIDAKKEVTTKPSLSSSSYSSSKTTSS